MPTFFSPCSMPSYLLAIFMLFLGLSLGETTARADDSTNRPVASPWLGPCDLCVLPDGNTMLTLEKDARLLRRLPIDGSAAATTLAIPLEPERMHLLPDGKRLVLVGGGLAGRLLVIDLDAWKIAASISVGHTPSDVAVFRDKETGQETAYVANRFGGNVSVVDLQAGRETARWPAGREPIALRVTPDGKKLLVAGHLSEDSALSGGISARLRFFNTADGTANEVRMQTGTMNVRDIVLSPDGRYAFVTGIVGHFEQVPSNVDGGWMNENLLFMFDVAKETLVPPFYYLDDYGNGAGNPWGVTVSDCGQFLVVANAGSCEICLVNLPRLIAIHEGRNAEDAQVVGSANKLPTRMRVPFGIKGLRRAVMNGGRVFAVAYFEDGIARTDLHITPPLRPLPGIGQQHPMLLYPERPVEESPTSVNAPLRFVPLEPLSLMKGLVAERSFARLGPAPVWTEVRRGEMLFHDAMICYEHWQSCASCHPEARSDCLNWDLLNDGIGNPKNTKSMLLSHETPPCMAHGIRADAETAVRSGIHAILFTEHPEEDACCIDEYLKTLQPVESPRLVDGKLSPAARRGKLLFDGRAGCAACHPAPLFTDLQMHDVGTRNSYDISARFDTPTLVECWRTAPYLHDGRYVTIRELIVEGKHYDTDGRFERLTEQEIDDLVEYVLSL